MRERFRSVKHNVKDKLAGTKRRFSAFDHSNNPSRQTSRVDEAWKTSSQVSFLGLPAEVRNDIYEHLASQTTLIIGTPHRKPPPVIGILLACKQTWREYRTLLLTNATIAVHVVDYNFSNLIRAFELMRQENISILRDNKNFWIELYLSHVPSREHRKALQAWCIYRADKAIGPYFKSGARVPDEFIFQYSARFGNHMRPPRPISRYTDGFEMKADLLRTHVRMATRLQATFDDGPNAELKRIQVDLEDCTKILEQLQMPFSRDLANDADSSLVVTVGQVDLNAQ